MSIQPPNGILDITGATLRVSKMEFSNVTGFDTVLNNVARNTVLHVDTTEYTANVAYAVKPPNMFMAQFDLELSAGGTGTPCNFNYYNDSNLGTSFNGYNLSFNDTSIILTYDGGSALHTATLSSSLNNGVYRKVKVLFDRDTTLVSINGENVFRFKDTLRPRTYDTGTTGYIRWWHNSPVARKIKNLKVSNGEKWAQEYDSGGLSSNISYTHGLVGVGTSVPEYTLDVAGDIRASGNLIVNGSNTLINTTSLAIEDNVIECGKGNSSAAKDLGFLMVRNDGSSTTNSNVAMFWDESTDALTFGFSDSGPTATTLTPNTTKTLNSYFVGKVGVGATPTGKFQVNISNASVETTAWDNTKVVFGDISTGNSQGLGFGVVTNSHASIISLAPGVAWRGLSYWAADHKWYGGGTHRMILNSSGNLGIGTNNPGELLHLYGTSHLKAQIESSGAGTASVLLKNTNGQWTIGNNATTADLELSSSAGTKVWLNQAGNVGIGTGSPTSLLELAGNSGGSVITLKRTNASNGGAKGGIRFTENTNGYNVATIACIGDGANTSGALCFYTKASSTTTGPYLGTSDEHMRIDSSGKVGIGGIPDTKLTVSVGVITTSGDITKFHSNYNNGNNGYLVIKENNHTPSNTNWTGYGTRIQKRVDSTDQGYIEFNPVGGQYSTAFGNGTTEYMRIEYPEGNVGIGTANPGEKLHVHEHLSTSGHQICARIGGTAHSSYNTLVFGSKEGRPHIGGHRGDYGAWADLSFQNDCMVIKQSNMAVGIGTHDPKSALHVTGAVNYNNQNTPGVEVGVHASNYAAIEMTGTAGHQSWIDFKTTNTNSDYADRILAGTGHMQIYTSNAERVRIDSSGQVGIGTYVPRTQLHLSKNSPSYTSISGNDRFRIENEVGNGSRYGLQMGIDQSSGHSAIQNYFLHTNGSYVHSYNLLLNPHGGNVGVGTNNPYAKLTVWGSAGATGNSSRTYFAYNDTAHSHWLNASTSAEHLKASQGTFGPISIYAQSQIVTGGYVMSTGGSLGSSDERIKKNIVDADDAECLETLRLLKPKKYQYRDVVERGEEPVWGFIAQEVRDTLPYATQLTKDVVPNIYELSNVSSSNVITFTNFNTSNLESNATTLIRTMGIDGEQHDVHLAEVIDTHTIRVEEDLNNFTGSLDAEGNVISEITTTTITPEEYEALEDTSGYVANISGYQNANVSISVEEYNALEDTTGYEQVVQDYTKTSTTYPGNQLFVVGQEVDDFVFLKKESIFTVATAALQEVDRQLQAEKTKTATLETQVAALLARVTALENA